jgi:hypothetical protein
MSMEPTMTTIKIDYENNSVWFQNAAESHLRPDCATR